MTPTHIFLTLDRAIDASLATRPTHILLGHTELTHFLAALRSIGTEPEVHTSLRHRGLHVIPAAVASLIQVGTLCAPYTAHTD